MSVGKHHAEQLLDTVFHYMGQELRGRLMVECPAAYNAYCGREVVKVVRTSDGTDIEPDKPAPVVYLPSFTHDPAIHPDEIARCRKCGHVWLEHGLPFGRCPDDEDEAAISRGENIGPAA